MHLFIFRFFPLIVGGFRDTYLGRQVVGKASCPEGQERGWGQLGVWGALAASSINSGVWGGAPAEIEFCAFLALKSDIRRQCLPLPLSKSAYAIDSP